MRVGIGVLLSALLSVLWAESAQAAPNAPTNLVQTLISPTEVRLTWNDNSSDEDGFYVSYSGGGSGARMVPANSSSTATYNDSVCPGKTKTYSVAAFNATGISASSNSINVTPPQISPGTPSDVSAAPHTSASHQIYIRWDFTSCNTTTTKIERSTSSSFTTLTQLGPAPEGQNWWYDNPPLPDRTIYYYRLRGSNSAGDSLPSETVSASIDRPLPPASLGAWIKSTTQIDVGWENYTGNVDRYILERSTSSSFSSPTVFTITGGNVYSYTDTPPTPNIDYYYRLKSQNNLGDSDYVPNSSPGLKVRFGTPSAPTALQVAPDPSNTFLILTWTDTANNESGTIVERGTSSGGPFTPLQVKPNGHPSSFTTFWNQPPNATDTYYYRIYVYNAIGDSGYSNVASGSLSTVVTPQPPSNLRIVP